MKTQLLEHTLSALYEEWCSAEDQNEAKWYIRWARAAIEASLPFYVDGVTDLGADGWSQWLDDNLRECEARARTRQAMKPARATLPVQAYFDFIDTRVTA